MTSLIAGAACSKLSGSAVRHDGRLTARPRTDVKTTGAGQIMLGLDRKRDAILQLPKNAGDKALPLLVMLHGATQSAEDMFWYLGDVPDETGIRA